MKQKPQLTKPLDAQHTPRPFRMLLLALVLGLPFLPLPGAADTDNDPARGTVNFFNGDQLHGDLLQITPEGMVRWQNPFITAPVEFAATNVASIYLPPAANVSPPAQGDAADIELTNGDQIRGTVTELTADTLKIATWFAGPMSIPRPMITSISPNSAITGSFYTGPNSLKEWTPIEQKESWAYEDGALVSINRGSIERDCKLGALSQVEFDMEWQSYLNMRVMLYNKTRESNPQASEGSLLLEITGNRAQLRGIPKQGLMNTFGSMAALDPAILTANKCRVGIQVNSTKKQVNLVINGKLVQQWTDNDWNPGQGTLVTFVSMVPGTKISKIRIGPWNGNTPITVDQPAEDQDAVLLVNQDRITGKVESIGNNKIALQTAHAPMTIPLDRVASIKFGNKNRSLARRRNGDARCEFVGGDSIIMQIQSFDGVNLVGKSDNFGSATFGRQAFSRLTLNIYSDRHDTSKAAQPGNKAQNIRNMLFLEGWNGD
jgi:hypothetical protein